MKKVIKWIRKLLIRKINSKIREALLGFVLYIVFGLGLYYILLVIGVHFSWSHMISQYLLVIIALTFLYFYAISRNLWLSIFIRLIPVALYLFFTIFLFAKIYQVTGLLDTAGNYINDFQSCLYFSVITFTTLGYGDLLPNVETRIFTSIEAVLGYIYLAVLAGMIVADLTKRYIENKQHHNKC